MKRVSHFLAGALLAMSAQLATADSYTYVSHSVDLLSPVPQPGKLYGNTFLVNYSRDT